MKYACKICGVVAFVCLLAATAAQAQDWHFKLRTNPYLELCQRLQVALDTRPSYPENFCSEDLPLSLNDPNFLRPDWEDLDPREHEDLVEALFWRLFNKNEDKPDSEREEIWSGLNIGRYDWDPVPGATPMKVIQGGTKIGAVRFDRTVLYFSPKDVLESGDVSLGRARFDLNFDGRDDTVYRVGFASCVPLDPGNHRSRIYSYHVIDPDDPDLDRGTKNYPVSGAFWFKGRIYVTSPGYAGHFMETGPSESATGSLNVYTVCEFIPEATEQPNPKTEAD